MKISDFLKEKFPFLVGYILFLLIVGVTLLLYGIPRVVFKDIGIFVSFIMGTYVVVTFMIENNQVKKLRQLTEKPLTKQVEHFLPPTFSPKEKMYQGLLWQAIAENADQSEQIAANKEAILNDFGLWLHQIKTPLSALDLLVQSGQIKGVQKEIFKINGYLQLILNYLRQNLAKEDLVIEAIDLEDVVKQELKKYAPFFAEKISVCN